MDKVISRTRFIKIMENQQ